MSEQWVRQQIDEASLPREELDSRLQEWQDNSQSKAGGGTKSLPCAGLARLNPEYCAHFGSPATGVTESEGEKWSEALGMFSSRRRLPGNTTAAFIYIFIYSFIFWQLPLENRRAGRGKEEGDLRQRSGGVESVGYGFRNPQMNSSLCDLLGLLS